MRHPIWKKDDFIPQGDKKVLIDVEGVQLPEERLPVVWLFKFEDTKNIVGWANDIRTEDGETTCEVEWTEKMIFSDAGLKDMGCRLGGYYGDIQFEDEARTKVKSCKLISVGLFFEYGGANPGAKV